MTVVRPAREEDVEAAAADAQRALPPTARHRRHDRRRPAPVLDVPGRRARPGRPARREPGRPARRLCGPGRPRRRRLAGRQGHRSRDPARDARGDRAAGDHERAGQEALGLHLRRRRPARRAVRADGLPQGAPLVPHARSTSTETSPEPEWPDGVSVRTMRDGEERRVYEAQMASFADTWMFAPEPYDSWLHWMVEEPSFDRSLWFIAEQAGEVAGIILSRAPENEPGLGWVRILGVVPEYRQRGLGQALLQHTFARVREARLQGGRPRSRRREPDRRSSRLRAGRDARRANEPGVREASGIIEGSWPSHA